MAKKKSSLRLTHTVNTHLLRTASVCDRHVLVPKDAFIPELFKPLKSAVIPCRKQIN